MFENAKWVCFDNKEEAPLIRREFWTENIESAEIDICGLGMFELYINGKKVSDDVLVPAWTDYEKRNQEKNYSFSHRIYYIRYHVTSYIVNGLNTIGIMLGNGWYNQYLLTMAGHMEYGLPKLCFSLQMRDTDGKQTEIISDEKLKWSSSHIYFNSIYYGEKQDLRLFDESWKTNGYNDMNWKSVNITKKPEALIKMQTCPTDKRIRMVKPILIQDHENKKIYDMGENISGWVKVLVKGASGEKVSIYYAEELNKDGTLNFTTSGFRDQIQTDEYISNGHTVICEPHFTFHGFRFCEVVGDAEVLAGVVVHSDVSVTSTFECDNEALNWFYETYIRTQLTNMHMGVPSDCPHRERLGYTGDGQLCSDAAMLLLDSREFYRKWIYDLFDCQDIHTGHIHHTAPAYGLAGGGPGGWGCAIVVVPYNFYKHFGEIDILKEAYPKMEKWIEYMISRSENGLVVKEEETGWCLGDWCTPDDVKIPEPYVNTYFLVKSLFYMKEIAKIIDVKFIYDHLIEEAKEAILRNYYDSEKNSFANSIQGSDVFALDIGIGNKELLEKLADHYKKTLSFDTGIFGTYLLLKTLFAAGYADVAVDLLSSEKLDTFGHMRKKGATTFWERWNGNDFHKSGNSHNHPMFGACVNQLFYNLVGIRINYDNITISPVFVDSVKWIKGSLKTAKGIVSVEYSRIDDKVRAIIDVEGNESIVFKYKKSMSIINGKNNVIWLTSE